MCIVVVAVVVVVDDVDFETDEAKSFLFQRFFHGLRFRSFRSRVLLPCRFSFHSFGVHFWQISFGVPVQALATANISKLRLARPR